MNKNLKIAVIGLGYVGIPLAAAFAYKGYQVIGFDLNEEKINLYKQHIDPTSEVGSKRLSELKTITYTANEKDLEPANFYIVAVPTPINKDKTPDLTPLIKASEIVSRHLKKGDYVVFESTVYPGVTDDVCVPILETGNGLVANVDFKYGYSPERINPGDHLHRLENIVKVVAGSDDLSLDYIAKVYEEIIEVGVFRAKSIKVAEAAKVIENSQRDLNIAFMNELALIFDLMDIDTKDVLDAAGTKWNFLKFSPGLVGGHCIGVDPYYLTYKAQALGYHPEVILAGRKINDGMGKWIAEKTIKKMISHDIKIKKARVLIMGLTFKENCGDLRNSKVIDIIKELRTYGIEPIITDPLANKKEAQAHYGVSLISETDIKDMDAVILAVAHDTYKQLSLNDLKAYYRKSVTKGVLIDVKSMVTEKDDFFDLWRL